MSKFDLELKSPLMNAAGSLGFAPDPRGPVELSQLGAFITNPVSMSPRKVTKGTRYLDFPGGFILHTGHPNPGFRAALHRYKPRWARSPVPVLVHLLFNDIDELLYMLTELEEIAGVSGVEVGLPTQVDVVFIRELIISVSGELPVIIRLPMERAAAIVQALAEELLSTVSAVSIGPPRGALPGAKDSLMYGRLYGPGLFPQTLAAVKTIAQFRVPVIAAGGVYHPGQVEILLKEGAIGVQLDAVLWRGIWPTAKTDVNVP